MRLKFTRDFYIPKTATKVAHKTLPAVVYLYGGNGLKLGAMGFYGKADKPSFHYTFRDEARRAAYVAQWFANMEECAKRKADRQAERKSWRHDVKVGDIFRSSWGYDQTNIDYYQIVELIGNHYAMAREIGAQSQDTGWLQGDCVPAPNQWATEADYDSEESKKHREEHGSFLRREKPAFKVRIQGPGEPHIKVRSFAHATRMKPVAEVGGVKMYGASHWTAYA